MIPYIINAGLLVTGCFAFYKIFLQKETFYRLNRSMLILCLLISFVLPLIPVPQEWSFRRAKEEQSQSTSTIQHLPAISHFVIPSNNAITQPSIQPEPTSPLSRQATVSAEEPGISISQVIKAIVWLYWFGVIVLTLNFLLQLLVLTIRAYRYPSIVDGQFRIIELNGDQAPCSFLNYIFINPRKYDPNTYNQILLHEKVHVSERHSIDILFAEIMIIFQWFNPFAWMYRKEMENNLEFLTDETVLEKGEMEITNYQMSLLKVSAAHLPLSLTTNYNQSLLKKRIVMMNARKSNLNSGWKYFFLLPMLILFACLLNEPVALAQDKKNNGNKSSNTNAQKPKPAAQAKPAAKANASKPAQESKKNETVQWKVDNDGMKTQGYWFATIKGDKIDFEFTSKNQKDEHHHNGSDFKVSDFPNLPKGTAGDFSLTREAGTFKFNGKFDGNEGSGTYKFTADKGYTDFINQRISDKIDEEDQMVFFMLDVKKSYVQMLNDEGYTKLDKDNVIAMTALNVDKAHIEGLKQNGFTNVDADDIISTKALNIDGDYIKGIRDAGYKDITLDQIVSFKAQGIDKEYLSKVSKMKGDNEKMDADDVISMKAMGIDDHYADQFKSLGYTNIKTDDLVSMKAVGITPEFIKSFQNAGYKDVSVENLISMKSVGVTPEFLKGFQALGYNEIDADNLISLKAVGVTPEFIKGFQQIGYKNIPIDQAISVKAVGVTPAYVKSMKQKGFNYNSLEKYVTLKSIGSSD
jgi:beta-lactamase regulating signal transducer with metallopeptidase domain